MKQINRADEMTRPSEISSSCGYRIVRGLIPNVRAKFFFLSRSVTAQLAVYVFADRNDC
jgi:hypothetical protein